MSDKNKSICKTKNTDWARKIIEALADGLTAYMTLQSKTGLSPAYSEFLLYDPIVRISQYQGWNPINEYVLDDRKRLDFLLIKKLRNINMRIAIEVKWFAKKKRRVLIKDDLYKLKNYKPKRKFSNTRRFLFLAGIHIIDKVDEKKEHIKPRPIITPKIKENVFYETSYKTRTIRYGVTVYEI